MLATQGGILFPILNDAPTSKSLKTLLISKHNAKSRVILEKQLDSSNEIIEHYRLRPLTYADTTHLLHPSPITFACLDYIFQNNVLELSSHGIEIFTHLDELKYTFHIYVLLHMMFSIHKQLPDCVQSSKQPPRNADECLEDYENRVYMPYIHNILNCLDNIYYIDRVNKLSDIFIRSLKYDLSIGVIPFMQTHLAKPQMSTSSLTLESMMNAYLLLLENAMGTLQVPSLDQIKNNIIVTVKQGVFSCTTFDGTKLQLLTYHDKNIFC